MTEKESATAFEDFLCRLRGRANGEAAKPPGRPPPPPLWWMPDDKQWRTVSQMKCDHTSAQYQFQKGRLERRKIGKRPYEYRRVQPGKAGSDVR